MEDVSAAIEDASPTTTHTGRVSASESAGCREGAGKAAVAAAVAPPSETRPRWPGNPLTATDRGEQRGEKGGRDSPHGTTQRGADDGQGVARRTGGPCADLEASGTLLAVTGSAGAGGTAANVDENQGFSVALRNARQTFAGEAGQAVAAASAVRSSSVEPGVPSPTKAGGGIISGSGGLACGNGVELCAEGCAGGEEGETASSCHASLDSRTESTECFHCAASCWFACACDCHADTAVVASAAAAGTDFGKSVRSRAAGSQPPRRKRPRKEPGLILAEASARKAKEVATVAPSADPRRAFLATSECGAGPRTIRFGTAARFDKRFAERHGRGGGAAPDGEASGAGMSYDTR